MMTSCPSLQDTYFELKYLNEVTNDLLNLDARFSAITEKYNNIFSNQHKNKKRLELAWLVKNIINRLPSYQFKISVYSCNTL